MALAITEVLLFALLRWFFFLVWCYNKEALVTRCTKLHVFSPHIACTVHVTLRCMSRSPALLSLYCAANFETPDHALCHVSNPYP